MELAGCWSCQEWESLQRVGGRLQGAVRREFSWIVGKFAGEGKLAGGGGKVFAGCGIRVYLLCGGVFRD